MYTMECEHKKEGIIKYNFWKTTVHHEIILNTNTADAIWQNLSLQCNEIFMYSHKYCL